MHLLFYFITVGGKRSCQGPGLVSGKPLSAFVSLQSLHYWKVPWRREGAPWRDRKQCSVGQQSHFWNHHRSHGLLTFPQSSSGERCFHWTSQGGGCRKVVGTAHPGTHRPPPPRLHSPETVHCRQEHSLFKCYQGTEGTLFHQNNQKWCNHNFSLLPRVGGRNWIDLTVRCHKMPQKYLILIKAKSIQPQSIARMKDIGT